jgi:hypothetical protein
MKIFPFLFYRFGEWRWCNEIMGRTIPSFRITLAMEKEEWKPFHNALGKGDRKKFDEMFDLPKFYISACANSVQYMRLHPILMSILCFTITKN